MRNTYGSGQAINYKFGVNPASTDQIAIVRSGDKEVAAAIPVTGDNPGYYDLDITRLPADFDLMAALKIRRENNLDATPITNRTHFLTTVPDYSERTRILALDGNTLALNDDELSEWLVEAERNIFLGIDNHPIFETGLEDTACFVKRLPNGLVSMTEVPRAHVRAVRNEIGVMIGEQNSSLLNITIETPLRCVARYFLTALPQGDVILRKEKESEVTAFVLISTSGFSYGLWSPRAGLFTEYAFPSPHGISGRKEESKSSFDRPDEADEKEKRERLDTYIRYAFDQLFLQLLPEKLDQLQLSSYAQVVWATDAGLSEVTKAIAAEYVENTGLEFIQLETPVEEAAAGGLLFGSFNFGDSVVAGAQILPPINLSRDLLVLADKEEIEQRQFQEINVQKQRNRAVFSILAAPVLAVACLLALVADIVRSETMLTVREYRADAKAQDLKPALDRRQSYEANLKWYQEFIKQVSQLRRQQPVGIGLLYQLNSNYPFNVDPSFYVSEMKLLTNGGVEIKGRARNKDAVTQFLRTLEFAGGRESGTKLFSNLTYEVQEGVAATAAGSGQPNLPNLGGSNLGSGNVPPGIIVWSIKGNYLPIEEFIPPDPNKTPVPNPQAVAPQQSPGTAPAAGNQPAVNPAAPPAAQ